MIAHYFPPGTSSGTQRIIKFVKYLPALGWNPVVLTMGAAAYHPDRIDPSLLSEIDPRIPIERTAVWMPDRIIAQWTRRLRRGGTQVPATAATAPSAPSPGGGAGHGLAAEIRAWLQFPDDYGGWLIPGIVRGYRTMRRLKIDMIYSTCPSPVGHMIAWALQSLTGRPWVADYRDPWECLFPTATYANQSRLRLRAEVAVAERVMRAANLVIANNEASRKAFLDRFPECPSDKFVAIPNGFDPADFPPPRQQPAPDGRLTITYSGTFFRDLRTPEEFLDTVRELVRSGAVDPARLRVRLVGCGQYAHLLAAYRDEPYLEITPRVTFAESLEIIRHSDVLLLLQQSPKYFMQVPAKSYEYMAAGKWILTIAPEGATRDLVAPMPNGIVIMPGDTRALREALLSLYERHKGGALYPVPGDESYVRRYLRPEQTRALAGLMDGLLARKRTAMC